MPGKKFKTGKHSIKLLGAIKIESVKVINAPSLLAPLFRFFFICLFFNPGSQPNTDFV